MHRSRCEPRSLGVFLALAALASALLLAPTTASAFTASFSAGELAVTAQPGETNVWTIAVDGGLTTVTDTRPNTPIVDTTAAAAGCNVTMRAVRCPSSTLANIDLDLGDGADTAMFSLVSGLVPIRVGGGSGIDSVLVQGASSADLLAFDALGTLRSRGAATLTFDSPATVEELRVDGGEGDDSLDARFAPLPGVFTGGNGNDSIGAGAQHSWRFDAGAGTDTLTVNGTNAADNIRFVMRNGEFQVLINGAAVRLPGSERLTIDGRGGDDTIRLERNLGRVVRGLPTANSPLDITARGGAGNDRMTGSVAGDRLFGDAGNDTIHGGGGGDHIVGGAGADDLHGGLDDDRIEGGAGADDISGGPGADTMFGGPGRDRLNGGLGINMMFQ